MKRFYWKIEKWLIEKMLDFRLAPLDECYFRGGEKNRQFFIWQYRFILRIKNRAIKRVLQKEITPLGKI
jgi:hypothetical protein